MYIVSVIFSSMFLNNNTGKLSTYPVIYADCSKEKDSIVTLISHELISAIKFFCNTMWLSFFFLSCALF